MSGEPPKLHHLALGAQNVASLAEFYRDVLGLPETERHFETDGSLRSVWLNMGGGAVLMIEKTDEPLPKEIDGHGAGLFLIALTADAETVEERCAAVLKLGIKQVRATKFTRYFRDPEGNPFAFSSYELPG